MTVSTMPLDILRSPAAGPITIGGGMNRMAWLTFLLVLAMQGPLSAQDRPDFSGAWTIDLARSEVPKIFCCVLRAISQTPEALIVKDTANDRERSDRIWTFHLNRWGPRWQGKQGVNDGAKLVQSRWDGAKLITVAGPGMNEYASSFLLVWSLTADGRS